jgi:DMSO/TMAO reductase YedYZ molybdopterin-dependent catalytic subunit
VSNIISRGFKGRRVGADLQKRIPPGQHLEQGFPVLTYGPTPHTSLDDWDFTVSFEVEELKRWNWSEFKSLPHEDIKTDIHCVTTWSKLDTQWRGVSMDYLLKGYEDDAGFIIAHCDGDYTTNLPIADVLGGKAWMVYDYEGAPLPAEHGGPARLLVPHLYFWKSAKWIRGLTLTEQDDPGFWERNGYHNHGDPWKEERYWNS